MTSPSSDFNKNAFSLTPTQLGEWVYHELTRGKSAYDYNRQAQRYDHIRFLMSAGADPAWNTDMIAGVNSSHKGYTLAMAAAYGCDVEALKILSEYKVSMDAYDSSGMSPLLYALQYADDPNAAQRVTETALFLISKAANVNNFYNPAEDAPRPIVQASAAGLTALVEGMIKAGADVNAKNSHGETALLAAVMRQKADVVKILLKAGADVNWVSAKTGKTLMEIAETRAATGEAAATEIRQVLKDAAGKQPPAKPQGPGPKV